MTSQHEVSEGFTRKIGCNWFMILTVDGQRQQRALLAFGGLQGLARRHADNQSVLQLPVRPLAGRAQAHAIVPLVTHFEFIPEPCHFLCLVLVIFAGIGQQNSPVPSRRPGLR